MELRSSWRPIAVALNAAGTRLLLTTQAAAFHPSRPLVYVARDSDIDIYLVRE